MSNAAEISNNSRATFLVVNGHKNIVLNILQGSFCTKTDLKRYLQVIFIECPMSCVATAFPVILDRNLRFEIGLKFEYSSNSKFFFVSLSFNIASLGCASIWFAQRILSAVLELGWAGCPVRDTAILLKKSIKLFTSFR